MQVKDADKGIAGETAVVQSPVSSPGEGKARPLAVVIDDDPWSRVLVRDILEPLGWQIADAADGRQGYLLCASMSPDLVITDLVMPEQEGLETIQMIQREFPHVRIIAMSGVYGGRFLRAASHLGAGAVLCKPFAPSQLIEAVGDNRTR